MKEGSQKIKKRKENLTTVQLIQEYDLVAMLEVDEISHPGVNTERLERSKMSIEEQNKFYASMQVNSI